MNNDDDNDHYNGDKILYQFLLKTPFYIHGFFFNNSKTSNYVHIPLLVYTETIRSYYN